MNEKYYVYELHDPTTNMPFYVGKGTGERAETYYKRDAKLTRATQVVIDAIRMEGNEVHVKKVLDNVSEQDALIHEAMLIKKYGRRTKDVNGILTNVQSNGQLSKPVTDVQYSTIQIPSKTKAMITQYCNDHGLKIGRFIENMFIQMMSGSAGSGKP